MDRFLRRAAAMLIALAFLSGTALHADTFTNIDVRQGVELGVLWNDAAQQTFSFPLHEGESYPLGDKRLLIRIPPELLEGEPRNHEMRLRLSNPPQTSGHAGQQADGGMTFEIPLGVTSELGRTELELSLVRDRRPLGIDTLRVARLTYVANHEEVQVVSVNRYPQLAWDGCPAPCYRRPDSLRRISAEDWRRALRIVEVDERGAKRTVADFDVQLSAERPASIVYAVDISGSILHQGGGDPSRRILEHFALFPDEAYGGDKVRDLDRLAMLFFNEEIVGYYAGATSSEGSSALIGQEPRFFAPRELSPNWEDYCAGLGSTDSGGRMDEAWLAGAETALGASGLTLARADRPAELICSGQTTPAGVLDGLRQELRRCANDADCQLSLPATDVLPALRRASDDLALLRQSSQSPGSVRDSQQAVILISDGLDVPARTADEGTRSARFREMRRVLQGRRFFFVDVHSELTLLEAYARAHAGQALLYAVIFDGIRQQVVDQDLGQLLIVSLAMHDDRALRARLLARLESDSLKDQLPGAPVLSLTLEGVLHRQQSLYEAFVATVQAQLPDAARDLLRGRLADDRRHGLQEAWLQRVARSVWIGNRAQARARPEPRRIRAEVNGLRSLTVDRFYEMAHDLDGFAVSAESCTHETEGGAVVDGPACAFRKILDALRGTLHVRYAPGHELRIERVEIALTAFGRRLLAQRQMPGARLTP